MARFILMLFVLLTLSNVSCKKETSCEGCKENNKPPIAIAGPSQVITLPTDSISLDGSASNDPDGTISNWLWTKISGPASFNIIKPTDSTTLVKTLTTGTYQFELKVTDNGGLGGRDTVQIIVNDPSQPNRPPVANAGADQTITIPTNGITINGQGSTDPDNNITSYLWTKMSGPSSFNIANASVVQTQVTNLIEGVYQFELKVTDAGGLFSKDSMQVTVNSIPPPSPCNNIWPVINATYSQIASLSDPRQPVAMSAGNKVVFAGGWKYGVCGFQCDEADFGSSAVDIYDMSSQTWSITQLSKARGALSAINNGNKIFFAGGHAWACNTGGSGLSLHVSYDNVDVYDVSANAWSVAHLSKPRSNMAVASVGSKVIFAGGYFFTGLPFSQLVWDITNRVDIYDLTSNQWSTATLSLASMSVTAKPAGNKVYFDFHNGVIDIYDNASNTWATSDLQTVIASLLPPTGMGPVDRFDIMGDNIIFQNSQNHQVGIRNLITGFTSVACLAQTEPACIINNNIVFFDGGTHFSIYNTVTGVWSTGLSNSDINIYGGSFPSRVVSLNNTIYFGGGGVCPDFTNKAFSLTW